MDRDKRQSGYAGDVSSREAWDILASVGDAVLVDVRTDAEWAYVGLPDLSSLGKRPLLVAWQRFPDMAPNEGFRQEIADQGLRAEQTILLICRSGQRSRHAATELSAAGYRRCFNVADGFEGPCDGERHRGGLDGWKAAGLPWRQS